jgi:hypothetical protein
MSSPNLPKIILKTDLETWLRKSSHEKFCDLVEGRIYVPKEYRIYVNKILSEKFGRILPPQMKIDAYAILVLKGGVPLDYFCKAFTFCTTVPVPA